MTPEARYLHSTLDEWIRQRPQSQAVKDREAHAKDILERYYQRKRDSSVLRSNCAAKI